MGHEKAIYSSTGLDRSGSLSMPRLIMDTSCQENVPLATLFAQRDPRPDTPSNFTEPPVPDADEIQTSLYSLCHLGNQPEAVHCSSTDHDPKPPVSSLPPRVAPSSLADGTKIEIKNRFLLR